MHQICGQLHTLAAAHIRTAAEILIDTGRRPEDVVALPLDCLASDADGSPVLVYDNHKANRLGRRLPIPTATAQAIRAQQQRVRGRFPGIPTSELKLLPTGWANRYGRRPMTVAAPSAAHRDWISSLPPLLLADGTEYDKDRVVPYAYRHTYVTCAALAARGTAKSRLGRIVPHRYPRLREPRTAGPGPGSFLFAALFGLRWLTCLTL